jgi:tRNA(Ile)-lysidine synthase
MHRLEVLVRRAVREHRLWLPGEGVLVAVSGGADSTALLAVLATLPPALRPRLVAAHFDHGWRAASAGDAAAARSLAARLHVPFAAGSAAAPPGAEGGSLEGEARRRRYAFLARTARAHGCTGVAVGHQRDDQAETVLMRLVRGAGAAGLAGMPFCRPLDAGAPPLRLVRPMLSASRADVLDYLRATGLPWREDETNQQPRFLRNRLRLWVLPALGEAAGPGASAGIARSAANLRIQAEALATLAEGAVRPRLDAGRLDVGSGWADQPAAVRLALLQAWWRIAGGGRPLRRDVWGRVDRLRDGACLPLPGGGSICRTGRWLQHLPAGCCRVAPAGVGAGENQGDAVGMPLPVPGAVHAPGIGEVTATLVPWGPLGANRWQGTPRAALGDAAAVRAPLRLRAPRPGERLPLAGLAGARKVRAVLAAAGIPVACRTLPWVVEDADGVPLWVIGVRATACFGLRADTTSALLLHVQPAAAAVPAGCSCPARHRAAARGEWGA